MTDKFVGKVLMVSLTPDAKLYERRFRWIVKKRDDGRYIVRAPKMGVRIGDLHLMKSSDFGPEKLLPRDAIIHGGGRKTKRSVKKSAPKRSLRMIKSSSPRKSKLPEYNRGYSTAYAPDFKKYEKELDTYTTAQKRELLSVAIIYRNYGLVKKLLKIGVKPGFYKYLKNDDSVTANKIRKVLEEYDV